MEKTSTGITRRRFIQLLTVIPCTAVVPHTVHAVMAETGNYYLKHRDTLIEDFEKTNQGAYAYLKSKVTEDKARQITKKASAQFKNIVLRLPGVGGEQNDDTQYLIIGAWYLAYYRPMKELNMDAEDVGRMIYDLNKVNLEHMPQRHALEEGDEKFSSEAEAKMKAWAESTQLRKYPGNWVAGFVKGNGDDFDFGYNYTECALCKFYNSQGTPELAPFVCLNDFIRSKRLNTGLDRIKTLGQGDDICNFRYKHGRPVTQSWNTEIVLILKRIKEGHVCTVPE
ncbi:MAG: L-2-amino-thiazoline-4-carboxylic acid hydrolase [Desulfobacteraceae bacterium]|nr:L-2-amino-thiazoline-4-carboxylic acid hydrolase [Desulfobacteraceae bacterium]